MTYKQLVTIAAGLELLQWVIAGILAGKILKGVLK